MTGAQLFALRIVDPSTWRDVVLRTIDAQAGSLSARVHVAAGLLEVSERTLWRWLRVARAMH